MSAQHPSVAVESWSAPSGMHSIKYGGSAARAGWNVGSAIRCSRWQVARLFGMTERTVGFVL